MTVYLGPLMPDDDDETPDLRASLVADTTEELEAFARKHLGAEIEDRLRGRSHEYVSVWGEAQWETCCAHGARPVTLDELSAIFRAKAEDQA